MSRREEFKTRMKEFKLYKDATGKGYWEWKLHSKVSSYALGGDNEESEEDNDAFAQFIKENPIQPGSVAPKDLVELNRMLNLPYELNEYQKQFTKAWYTQRAKYSKYDSLLGNGKLGRILEAIDKSTYLTIPEFAETELKEYMRINNIDKPLHPMEIELKSELLLKKDAMGFARPNAYAWHVKPKTIKTTRADYRGLGWHEGIGHIVGDNSTEIMGSAPKIWVKNQSGDKEYEKYINKQNEQHASTWEFRGANAEMLDDNGERYIDPNRQLTPYDIRRMKEKGATIPVEWRNSNITESDIANFLNSFAYLDKSQDTFDFNISNGTNEVFFGKNGGLIPSYEEGGTNEDRHTSIVTNTVKKALERGDILLVLRILKRGNKEDRKFYYPDNGSILSVLNIYDTPLLGDALSLLDALKYSVKGDWDNASLSYMDAVSPLALFSRSKLNWKGWGAKKKYIPEYEAIEREAKKNGTWLKNADGTDFTGDPREWVVKRSKKFREAFGDKYLEGYTGMRSPYNPRELLDTYLSSRERAYTYTLNKNLVKKKGDTGIAKLVVPDTDTYTIDALGNDWLHLTDKSINPYNFTNTNLIVSSILTPVISFKNIRDDGPFGMRDIAEDQFVAKSTTPRKSVLYNNGDFDLSNPDIFKITAPSTGISPYLFMYGADRIRRKANRENTQSYATGGETEEGDKNQLNLSHPYYIAPLDVNDEAYWRLHLLQQFNNFIKNIHTDPITQQYNAAYNALDDTYGPVPLPEVTVTAPWTKLGRNNADARRGMHYMQLGLEDAAKIAAPIVAGAALPAIASTGALGTITDLASIATNPIDPLNYIPYEKYLGKYLGKYIFLKRPNSFTRGIGGEQGLQDLIESGLVRGNPIGTEMTAHNFTITYKRNRDHFRDIMDGTGIEGISNRYYNRTLSRDDFDAIKKLALLFEDSYVPYKVGKFNLTSEYVDPLSRYKDYEDYLQVLKLDRQTFRKATSLDDNGLPLAYFYDDGRNPITEGHSYAKSIYGVRINNASSYNPRIFRGHLHYSFPEAVPLNDPNVEVFKKGIFGITTKMNKSKLNKQILSYKDGGKTELQNNDQGWLSRLINVLVNPMPFIYSNPTLTLSARSIEADKQRDDIRYNRAVGLSKSIYEAIRASQGDPAALPIEVPLSVEPVDPIEPDVFDPGQAFFLTKDDLKRFFENNGYRTIRDIDILDEDIFKRLFGTVRGAAKLYLDNGYLIPIYEYTADSDTTVLDSNVVPVGNFYSASGYIKPKKYISTTDIAFLPHSGNHSNTVYLHKNDGKLYVRSWDLNDYGTGSSGSKGAASTYNSVKKRAANSLDISGNPFILRTGYVPLLYKELYDALPEKVKLNIPSTAILYLKPIPDDLNYKKVVEKAKLKRSKQRNK